MHNTQQTPTPANQKLSLTRRWVRARPGSVLILVIALLVLLALIGTAYLSSTQTERYTSHQNTANTEADLLVDGVVLNVESKIAASLYGSNGSTFRPPVSLNPSDTSYQTFTNPGYNTFTSPQFDDFLADRTPVISPTTMLGGSTGVPTWGSISWPLFTDSTSNYSFDSPFATSSQKSAAMYVLANKQSVEAIPTYQTINGKNYPALLYYVPPQVPLYFSPPAGGVITAANNPNGGYLIPLTAANPGAPSAGANGLASFYQINSGDTIKTSLGNVPVPVPSTVVANPNNYAPLLNIAASATGEGIADAGLFKVPTGPIDGITYYAAMRVIDNNSAVNVSTAWTAAMDPSITGVTETQLDANFNAGPNTSYINYGFFRSNIGLRELLNGDPTITKEMDNLNYYRFNQVLVPVVGGASPVLPSISATPIDDKGTPRTDYTWMTMDGATYLAGDALDSQLARKTLDVGYNSATQKYLYMDKIQSAAMASRFSLGSPNATLSNIEQLLPYELSIYPDGSNTAYRSTPYSPTQIGNSYQNVNSAAPGTWFGDLFDYHQFGNYSITDPTHYTPARTLLTASNPVSNGTASRLGNVTAPPVWSSASTYSFGDLVTSPYTDTSVTPNVSRNHTFVCLQPVITPGTSDAFGYPQAPPTIPNNQPTNVSASTYWSLVPFTNQPVKTSVVAGTFEQLWLAFCHVMTDSVVPVTVPAVDVTATAKVPQWQPPLIPSSTVSQTAYGEEQMPQFRSVIRDNRVKPMSNKTNTGQPGNTYLAQPPEISLAPSPTYGANGRVQLTPMQMMQLRAAIAAINLENLRNANAQIGPGQYMNFPPAYHQTRSRRIVLPDTSGNPAFEAEVFGNDIQPFISQMYANVVGPGNEGNFIALQMINPYPVDITCTNWVFTTINRKIVLGGTPGAPSLTLTTPPIARGTATWVIPKAQVKTPGGPLVPGIAVFYDGTPPGGFPPLTGNNNYEVPGLASGGIGYELIILRPRAFGGNLTQSPGYDTPGHVGKYSYFDRYNENRIYDLVPVDQIDLTGTDTVVAGRSNLYYRRAADPAVVTTGMATYAWNFVWPGFYTPYNSNNTNGFQGPFLCTPTSAANSAYYFNQPIIATDTKPSSTNLNFASLGSGPPVTDMATATTTSPTYNTITLQLANTNFPGANPVTISGGGNCYPFGGFARNADLLQIPYIGAYRIINTSQQLDDPINNKTSAFYEMNSVSMDAALANDSTLQVSNAAPAAYLRKVTPSTADTVTPNVPADNVGDPFVEQIGHFCPIGDTNPGYVYSPTSPPTYPAPYNTMLDFGTDPGNASNPAAPGKYWHYHWAKRLFDYLSVQTPNDDYYPNVDPDRESRTYVGLTGRQKYIANNLVVPTLNTSASSAVANIGEDTIGVEGLININTAPWPVLATLPFVPRAISPTGTVLTHNINYSGITTATTPNTSGTGPDDNVLIAKAIVDYRTVNGPFKSILDLYNVPAFRRENDALLAADPGPKQGDFSPGGIIAANQATNGTDGARFDFEERFLLLNQISNLITTRSDTFTCYVDLQGWRNVGSGSPTLAVERRRAFIFDRNAYTPLYKNPVYFPVSTGN